MSRMARPRDLNFTTELNSVVNNRREHSKRAAVLIREPSSEVIDVDEAGGNTKKDNNKDVIILVRDRRNLSLALRKLQCCSQCFSPNIQSCQCRQRQDSTVSVISNGSLNKCHKCKVRTVLSFIEIEELLKLIINAHVHCCDESSLHTDCAGGVPNNKYKPISCVIESMDKYRKLIYLLMFRMSRKQFPETLLTKLMDLHRDGRTARRSLLMLSSNLHS